jgi:uncharacterized membrane protein required for colicin V production
MIVDILFLIAAGYGFYLGFSRGIIKTVFTVLSIMIGVVAAAKFGPAMTDFLESVANSQSPLMFIAGLLLTFVATMLLIRIAANVAEKGLETANINIINQVAGGLVMGSILTLIYSTLILFSDRSHIIDENTKTESMTYEYLIEFPGQFVKGAKKVWPVFEDLWDHSVDFMDRMEKVELEQKESDQVYDIEDTSEKEAPRR